MRNFISVQDIGDLKEAVKEAMEIKADRYKFCEQEGIPGTGGSCGR